MSKKEIVSLALLVGILPHVWAVASPYLGNSFGPVALIAAGIYGCNGNKFEDAGKIAAGYLLGDVWALAATLIMRSGLEINPDVLLFAVLFVLGFLAVVISCTFARYIFMPSWLAGWAIGMLAMNLETEIPLMSMTVQIAVSMMVGVFYVGALLDKIHCTINR